MQVLTQAAREMDSDFELASLLIGSAGQLVSDDATRRAYLDAARSIDSDFELHRVLMAAVARAGNTPAILVSLLQASESIGSDFEEASLLTEVVASARPLDGAARGAFFKALATVDSDFEHHRVLTALAGRPDPATTPCAQCWSPHPASAPTSSRVRSCRSSPRSTF